jgi:hypothetical protein
VNVGAVGEPPSTTEYDSTTGTCSKYFPE